MFEVFEKHHEEIYNDYLSVEDKLIPWPEKHLYDYGWEVQPLFVNPSYEKLVAPFLDKKYKITPNECMLTKKLIQKYIGKLLINNKNPFGLIKLENKNFNFDADLRCGDAKIKVLRPNWF